MKKLRYLVPFRKCLNAFAINENSKTPYDSLKVTLREELVLNKRKEAYVCPYAKGWDGAREYAISITDLGKKGIDISLYRHKVELTLRDTGNTFTRRETSRINDSLLVNHYTYGDTDRDCITNNTRVTYYKYLYTVVVKNDDDIFNIVIPKKRS